VTEALHGIPDPIVPEGLDATLVLLRHGESELIVENRFQGQSETPLSPDGLRQAALAGDRLARPHASPALPVPQGMPLEIVHSPLARTAQTAAAVSEASPPSTVAACRCAPSAGSSRSPRASGRGCTRTTSRRATPTRSRAGVGGRGRSGRRAASPSRRSRHASVPPSARSSNDSVATTRAGPHATQPWAIVVGHDGGFKVALLTLFGLPLTHFWMFTMALTGITVVELRGGRPVLRAANLTEHLAPLLDERAQQAAEQRAASGAL